jgi:glycosyltransferase involved in cell wall biosynthesis
MAAAPASQATGAPVDRRRILFLSNDVAYLFKFRAPLMRTFLEKGYEVVAVAPPGDGHYERRLAELGAAYRPWRVRSKGRNALQELRALADLGRHVAAVRPGILFSYTIKPVIYGTLIGALFRVRRRVALVSGLGYAFIEGGGLSRRLTRSLVKLGYRVALSFAHTTIFMNREDSELFRASGLLKRRAHVGLVNGSGVDMGEFAFAPMPEGPPVFLLVARLHQDKGVYEFIEAARIVKAHLPEARFVLVGAPDGYPTAVKQHELDQWVAEGVVEHRGFLRDPAPEYRACTIFVLPSYREGAPRTNFEAMATGRAVITTDVPGCRDTVEHGVTGLLVPARDAQALAATMLELGGDPARARQMGLAGHALCRERYEVGSVARATVALIEG